MNWWGFRRGGYGGALSGGARWEAKPGDCATAGSGSSSAGAPASWLAQSARALHAELYGHQLRRAMYLALVVDRQAASAKQPWEPTSALTETELAIGMVSKFASNDKLGIGGAIRVLQGCGLGDQVGGCRQPALTACRKARGARALRIEERRKTRGIDLRHGGGTRTAMPGQDRRSVVKR